MSAPSDESETDQTTALAIDLRVVTGKLIRRLREQAGAGELTESQKAPLLWLEREGPATVTAMAKAAGVRPQSMGATVATLEAANLIQGAPDPKDGRQTLWSLTDAFVERLRAGRAAREDWLSRALHKTLAPEERDQLAAALPLLRRLVES